MIAASSTLLTGAFDSAEIIDLGSGIFEFQNLGATFLDTKHPELVAFYGMPGGQYQGGLNLSFQTTANVGDSFTVTTTLGSGDILNQPVPVTAAVWLFLSGLLGIVGISRRRI